MWNIAGILASKNKLKTLHNSLWWHRGSRLDCGLRDLGLIPSLPSPHGRPVARIVNNVFGHPNPCQGRLLLATYGVGAPQQVSIWNWTTVSSLYSWNIAECDCTEVKPQQNLTNSLTLTNGQTDKINPDWILYTQKFSLLKVLHLWLFIRRLILLLYILLETLYTRQS